MIGQQLNMGTTYWVLFWVCLTARIVITFAKYMMNRGVNKLADEIIDSWKL
jgi:hypothetical protein